MKLYVVRHGTTDNNVNKLVNGRNDIDINEQGKKDAKKAKAILGNLEFDQVFCSPLLRAKHTMEIINEGRFPVIYEERLMERDAGILTSRSEDLIDYDLWYKINASPILGVTESFDDVIVRVKSLLEELKNKYRDKTVLFVTHSGVMTALEVCIYGYPGDDIVKKWVYPNGIVKKYNL